jgi:hypothetical protein
VLYAIVLVASVLVVVSFAQQGGKKDDEKAQNLKVLDPNISHDELIGLMNKFSNSLGVGCDHCHAASKTDAQDLDFASDDNKVKLTARRMLEMVTQINGTLLANLPTNQNGQHMSVECVTCHHGQPKPISLQDLLLQVRKERGMTGLDSTYRQLRNDYYGGFTYDFGERTLGQLAQTVAEENHADALTILRLNQEFNPKSAYTQWAMGRVYTMMGDTTSAIDALKRALEIMPEYRRAKRDLDALTGGGKK